MRITRSYIRNLDLYVHPTLRGQFVRVIAEFSETSPERLQRIGLKEPLEEGESYLPPSIGRTSRFNAEGKWITQRDQPKELRYIRTVQWKWKQFIGRDQTEDVEDSRDIFRRCYPRDLILPPSEEVFGFPVEDRIVAATEAVALPNEAGRLLHQVNLMLELFGACEVVRADGTSASPARTHRRWVFLPSGPFSRGEVVKSIEPVLAKMNEGDRLILTERQEFLTGLEPQEVAQGEGGFNDYLAYVFPQFGRVVLESLRRDNAIYVFQGQWERFSRFTKREILDAGVHDARILHSKGWQGRLLAALENRAAA